MHSTPDERSDERRDDPRGAEVTCASARSLVPGYLDGELTEAQAGPLRAHLFACPACREAMKEEKALKRWFAAADLPAVEVPAGFAARVARRAFAGDPGLRAPAAAAAPLAGGEAGRGALLPFVLRMTAAAAVLLFVLAVAIQRRSLPAGEEMRASEDPPWERRPLDISPVFRERPAVPPAPAPAGEETGRSGDRR
ncbi:MAG: zf-HC2 domain-containing protein [Planctomycetota bacterium]